MKLDSLPRIRLSTLLILVGCIAIGLATTRDLLGAIRPAIEAAMVVGLLQQTRELLQRHCKLAAPTAEARFAWKFAIAWRVLIAAGVAFFLLIKLNGWTVPILFPHRSNPLLYEPATVIGDLLPIVILANSVRRWRPTLSSTPRRRLGWLIFCAVALLVAIYNVVDSEATTYLVHQAVAGIEASITPRFQRPDVYSNLAREGYRSFWLSCLAAASVPIGAIFLVVASRWKDSRIAKAMVGGFFFCLAVQLLYCRWFYLKDYPRISPDIAGAGLAVEPSDWLSIVILLSIVITLAAYLITASDSDRTLVSNNLADGLDRRSLHETGPCLVAMNVAAAIELGMLITGIVGEIISPTFANLQFNTWMKTWLNCNLLFSPLVLLACAFPLLSLQLSYVRWARRKEEVHWELPVIHPKQFALNWLAAAIAILIGAPTLAAFGFLFWLGPFNLSGI